MKGELVYQQHVVRVREDLWKAVIPFLQGDGYHNSFQEFIEKCIVEKVGLDGSIEMEISKTEVEIKRLQELNAQRIQIFKTKEAAAAKELEKKIAEDKKKEQQKKRTVHAASTIFVWCPECGRKQTMMRQSSSRKCCGCKKEIKKEDWIKEELKKI